MVGNLIIVSAPSGAGKTTLVEAVQTVVPNVRESVSYTSRPPRAGETEGEHYHFVTREQFEAMIAAGEFLEFAEVHGKFYGTARRIVENLLAAGNDVLLTIDVQGAAQTRRLFPAACSVFVMPPSKAVMLERLAKRGANSPADLQVRLQNALVEMAQYSEFDYVIVNDGLTEAVNALAAIILAERCRRARRTTEVDNIRQTFFDLSTTNTEPS